MDDNKTVEAPLPVPDERAILVNPSCFRLRTKTTPDNVQEIMEGVRGVLLLYPEHRRKGRAV